MNRVAWIVEKSGFQKNFEKFWLKKFSIQVCLESSRFLARVAKGRPAFWDRIFRGNLESKIVYRRVVANFENRKKYFRLIMIRVAWNMNKSSFQKNF